MLGGKCMTVKKKTRLTSYNFWVRIVSAVVLILRIILSKFGINIDSAFILDIATLVAGFLVVVGIINEPTGITISYKNESGDDMVNTENIKTKIDEKLKEVEKIFAGFGIKDKAVVAESLQKIDDFLVTILQNELRDIEKMQNELDGKTDESGNEETEKSERVGAKSEKSELNGRTDETEVEEGVNEKTEYENKEILKTGNVQSEEYGVDSKNECIEAVAENEETEETEDVEAESNKDQSGVAESKANVEANAIEVGVAEAVAENDEFKETEVGVSETETSGEMGKSEVEASENGINEIPEIGVAENKVNGEVEETDSEIIENEETDADTLTASEIAEASLEEINVGAESDEKIVENHNTNQQENTNLQDTDRQQGVDVQDANRQEINLQDANEQDVNEDDDRQQGVDVQDATRQQSVDVQDADQSRQVVNVNFADPQGVSQPENSQSAIELIKNLQDEFCGGDQTKRGEFCDRLLNILENNLDSLV